MSAGSSSTNSCGKMAFRSKADAKRYRGRIPKAKGKRIYLCPVCDLFHLTTMTLSAQRDAGLLEDDQ